jgi:hypothetical protein
VSMIFGGGQKGPDKINTVPINQSVLGYPVPWGWGRFRIQQSLLWLDGFSNKKVSASGGKGFGGGKGGTQYVYSADVIAALCHGGRSGIRGIGDVWSGQSWLPNTTTSEDYIISGGSPVYTPTNADFMTADLGVSTTVSYSATVTDVGSGGVRTLSGSSLVGFARVDYGTTLATGQYSVNPADNKLHFAPVDSGTTVHISYSFSLSYIRQQDIALVPSGREVLVGSSSPQFKADVRVEYYTGPNNGQQLTRVPGSGFPTATGTYTVSGSGPASYKFATADINAEILITFQIDNTSAIPNGTQKSLAFSLAEGTKGQSAWALLLSKFPGAAIGYNRLANVLYAPMDLGYSGSVQQNLMEVITGDAWGAGISDCNPVQCALEVLTDTVCGLGAGPMPFPIEVIDNGTGGTWGPGKSPASMLQDGSAAAWFAANGFFISPKIDRQDSAAAVIGPWLEAGQVAGFMSEGLFKLVPYGDTTTAGFGAVWTAPQEFATALDDTCFLSKGQNMDPVKLSANQDIFSVWPIVTVNWSNRANQYAPEPTPESDQAGVNRWGARSESAQTYDFITTLQAATFAASMRVKRNVYMRNAYEFSLSYRYAYLEPMDIVYITTSSLWAANLNNLNLGVNVMPVRVTKIVDNPDGTLDVTCEDYPFGVHEPTIYNKDISTGQPLPNVYEDPGDTTVAMMVATPLLADYHKNQLWVGAAGADYKWGGCKVHASMNGTDYIEIGTIKSPARLGTLGLLFDTGSDPDTVNDLVVNLVDNAAPLEAGSTDDADAANTLCIVESELISYSSCVLSGKNQFTMGSYIRRGLYGSGIVAHSAFTPFLRLDDSIFKYTFDQSWGGKSLWFKFQSFNAFGNSLQDLSDVTAIAFSPFTTKSGTVIEFGPTQVTSVRPTFGVGGRLPMPPHGAI